MKTSEEIEKLYDELEEVMNSDMDEVDKQDYISGIRRDIAHYERFLEDDEYYYTEDELEHERTNLCLSLGIPRY